MNSGSPTALIKSVCLCYTKQLDLKESIQSRQSLLAKYLDFVDCIFSLSVQLPGCLSTDTGLVKQDGRRAWWELTFPSEAHPTGDLLLAASGERTRWPAREWTLCGPAAK